MIMKLCHFLTDHASAHTRCQIVFNGLMLAPTVTVVRRGSGRVPGGRQLVAESVVDRSR